MTDYLAILQRLLPEAALALAALVVISADLAVARRLPGPTRGLLACLLSTVGCFIAWRLLQSSTETGVFQGGIWAVSPQIVTVKQSLVLLAAGACWLARGARLPRHVGEYFGLILLATVGAMLMTGTRHLLMAFVSLELLSLCLYILAAFDKGRVAAAESSLRYFLFGGVSAATLLYGISLLYGTTGELDLQAMSRVLASGNPEPLTWMGILFVTAGLAFKLAAAPFHPWAPDVYEQAPTPSAAYVSSASKLASFALVVQVTSTGWGGEGAAGSGAAGGFLPGWIPVVCVLAAASMVIGNLTALAQTGLKRLLAYSAVAHAGYILVGCAANSGSSGPAVLYYALTYAIGSMGAFGVIAAWERGGHDDSIRGLSGMHHQSPFLAGSMAIFLLSLAGIPPLAGFFAKFQVFASALTAPGRPLGLLWLVGLAIVSSCVALYYYLSVLKRVFVSEAGEGELRTPVRIPLSLRVVVACCAAVTVLLGCFPQWLMEKLAAR